VNLHVEQVTAHIKWKPRRGRELKFYERMADPILTYGSET
jgi:hypothetical protein